MSLPELPPPVAYIREWEGDVSDLGQWVIVGEADECDDTAPWHKAFTADQMAAYAESAIASLKSQLVEAQKDALCWQEFRRMAYDTDRENRHGLVAIVQVVEKGRDIDARIADLASGRPGECDPELLAEAEKTIAAMGKSEAAEQPSDRSEP